MTRYGTTLALLIGASLGVTACSDSIQEPTGDDDPTTGVGNTTGSNGNTFDHDNDGISVWDLINRLTQEGPPSFTAHMHGCSKVRYANFSAVLTSVGVDVTNMTALSAGALYKASSVAQGTANYANRIRENIAITTSGASSMFDVFAAAAPEVIAKLQTLPRCQIAGVAIPPLFDPTTNACNIDAITCLIGVPATQAHVDICNKAVMTGSTPDIGKGTAVAALMAAAYTCE
jgi:hypothetical protein